jgi:hypothetical protein
LEIKVILVQRGLEICPPFKNSRAKNKNIIKSATVDDQNDQTNAYQAANLVLLKGPLKKMLLFYLSLRNLFKPLLRMQLTDDQIKAYQTANLKKLLFHLSLRHLLY